jgi:hypothetical protein
LFADDAENANQKKNDFSADTLTWIGRCLVSTFGQRKDKLPAQREKISVFHSVSIPPMGLDVYTSRLAQYLQCSPEAMLMSLIMLNRVHLSGAVHVNALTVHRLLIACVLLATKMQDDRCVSLYIILLLFCIPSCLSLSALAIKLISSRLFPKQTVTNNSVFSNGTFALVGGLSKAELNALERKLFVVLDFDAWVSAAEFNRTYADLKQRFEVASPHGANLSSLFFQGEGGSANESQSCSVLPTFPHQQHQQHQRNDAIDMTMSGVTVSWR